MNDIIPGEFQMKKFVVLAVLAALSFSAIGCSEPAKTPAKPTTASSGGSAK